jgi:hypothetical protein
MKPMSAKEKKRRPNVARAFFGDPQLKADLDEARKAAEAIDALNRERCTTIPTPSPSFAVVSEKKSVPYNLSPLGLITNIDNQDKEINDQSTAAETVGEAIETAVDKKIDYTHPPSFPSSKNIKTSPPLSQSVLTSVSQSVSQSKQESVIHSVSQSVTHSVSQSETQSKHQSKPYSASAPDHIWGFTERQAKVLAYLAAQETRIARAKDIALACDLTLLSVRDVLRNLRDDGIIRRKNRYRLHDFQGFKYTLDDNRVDQFMQQRGWELYRGLINPTTIQSVSQSEHHYEPQSISPSVSQSVSIFPLSSSSFSKKTTTGGTDFLSDLLANDPELDYWLQKGLTAHQCQNWLNETGVDIDILIASLKHAAFELNDLEGEVRRDIKKPLHYFYSTFKKNRFWAAPAGYKSHKQKEIEFREAVLKQKLEEEHRLAELELKEEFDHMMQNPDSVLYQRCEERLNNTCRKRPDSSPLRRTAMRQIFETLKSEDDGKD